jgi:hypothetical protein
MGGAIQIINFKSGNGFKSMINHEKYKIFIKKGTKTGGMYENNENKLKKPHK